MPSLLQVTPLVVAIAAAVAAEEGGEQYITRSFGARASPRTHRKRTTSIDIIDPCSFELSPLLLPLGGWSPQRSISVWQVLPDVS